MGKLLRARPNFLAVALPGMLVLQAPHQVISSMRPAYLEYFVTVVRLLLRQGDPRACQAITVPLPLLVVATWKSHVPWGQLLVQG